MGAAAGLNNSQLALQVGLEVDRARRWRNRWLGLKAASPEDLSLGERLRAAPLPGAPVRTTPEQVCQIVALAGEAPGQTGRRKHFIWTPCSPFIRMGLIKRIKV